MKRDYTLEDWREAFLAIDRNIDERKKFIRSFKISKDSRILEIGCSDGMNLEALNMLGYRNIVGVDISKELLSKIKGYQCVCSDAGNSGIKSGSIDEIYCRAVLHHVDNSAVFSEMVRVLRPGGVIHILEPWPTIFRNIADFLTLYILHMVSKKIYYRKVAIHFEKETYSHWLKNCKKTLSREIEKHNLRLVRRHVSLFNIYMTVQKTA